MRPLSLVLLLFLVGGCQIGEIEHRGRVTFVEDGAFWGIVTLEGERFVPRNLPPEFHREGMEIEFEGFVLEEERAEGEWGIPVRLNEVEVELDRSYD